MSEDIDAPSETDPSRAVMERREEIARIVRGRLLRRLLSKRLDGYVDEAAHDIADAIMALPSPAPVAAEGKALGIALAALQHIQGMEPITHEITLATVRAQHATDALNDIRALHNGFCTNPCGEGSCAGELRIALVCDRCGWEDQ